MKRKFSVLKPLKKQLGIYKISCMSSDKVYIGETINLSQRISKHFNLLRKNTHSNPILQNLFNKYGEDTFEIDVLEYLDITDDVQLKTLEQSWQKKFPTCISLDSNEIYHIERSDKWKEDQHKILDEIREKAIQVCSKAIVIYNIQTHEIHEFSKISDGESLMERKHIDKNINKKIYIPYKNQYVAFYKEDFTQQNIDKIIIGSVYCDCYTVCNPINDIVKHFGSKNEFSLYFSQSRNDQLWDYFCKNNLVDFNFNCLPQSIESLENFFNSNIKLRNNNKSALVNIKQFYNGLINKTSNIELAKILGINRHTLTEAFKERSKDDWIKLITCVINSIAT